MPEIRHLIEIAAPPGAVYRLVSTREGLAQWWAADAQPAPDGLVEVAFFNRATVYRLRPSEMDPPSRTVWVCETGKEWEGTRLVFDLVPSGRGTTLRFAHADWRQPTDYFWSCNTTWGALMFRLKASAEGHGPGPLFTATGVGY